MFDMNAHQEIDVFEVVTANPKAIFSDENVSIEVLAGAILKREKSAKIDLGTDKGRKAIASRAYAVAKMKTSIDNAGKEMNAGLRDQINAVDATRRAVREKLDSVRDEIRKPLDEWERQEEARVASHKAIIQRITDLGYVDIGASSEDVEAAIREVDAINVSKDELQEYAEIAAGKKEASKRYLSDALERIRREESDRAELEKLRAVQEERDRRDQEERARREREEREAEQKRQAELEAQRKKAEIAHAAAEAAEKARRDAEENAERERQKLIKEHEEREAARLAEEERSRKEGEARARDRKHRAEVNNAAALAMATHCDLSEDDARKVVTAIAKGEIPNVEIRY
jgi:colicin import membrane protein